MVSIYKKDGRACVPVLCACMCGCRGDVSKGVVVVKCVCDQRDVMERHTEEEEKRHSPKHAENLCTQSYPPCTYIQTTFTHTKPYTTTPRQSHDKQTPSSSPRPGDCSTLHPHPSSIQATTTITPQQCLLRPSSSSSRHRHHQNRTRRVQEDVEIRHGLGSTTAERARKEGI